MGRRGPAAGAGPAPTGVAVVDKPPGWTSHDVVAKARGLLGTRRVGHAGTLDPMATGLLLLGVGAATRLLGYLRTLTIGSALVGFLPLSLLSHPLGWGLAGVWTGLDLFIGLRLVGVLARVAGRRWLSAGVGT